MFTSHTASRFLRKFKPLLSLRTDVYERSTLKGVHSLHKFKQKRPIPQTNRNIKKSVKSVQKDVEPKIYTRDTIREVSNILRYSTWDSAQEQLEKLSIRWDSYTVNQVLKTHPPMEKAWLFFNWASRLRGFKHDQFTYTTMLDIFGEARKISSMNLVFQKMQEKGIKIDAVTYTSLMHWLSNNGDVDRAVEMWREMEAKGCRPTVVSYTAYMKVLFDHKRVKEATEVYKEMIQSGSSPNCYTYTVLMVHLAGAGKFNELLEIFSKMQEAGVHPDKATCNVLVEKCSKAGETWAMMKILEYMKKKSLVLRYSVYVEALETLRIAGENDSLLRQINPHFSIRHIKGEKDEFISVTTADIDCTIDQVLVLNLLTRQSFVAVHHLLAQMMAKSIQLHSEIVSTIIEVYSAHSRPSGALLAFRYSVKMGIVLERTLYLTLVGIFIRTNSFPKVLEIVEEMFRAGYSLGTYLTGLLIYRLGCAKKSVWAVKVFDLLADDQKTTTAYTALIGAYFSCGNADKGLETFQIMRRKGIWVALATYKVLLAGLEKSGRVSEVEFYRKEEKRLQASCVYQHGVPFEDMISNLLFIGNVVS